MSDSDPSSVVIERRVMDRFGDIKRVPIPLFRGMRRSDGYLIAGGALGGFLVGSLFDVNPLVFTVAGLCLSILLVRASVSHKSTLDWVLDLINYLWRPKRYYAASADAPSAAQNDGGLSNITPFSPDTTTQDLTMIDRVWPGTGAVLRSDGRMEAILEIEADQMDHAQSDEWAAMYDVARDFANDEIENPVTLHVVTEPFDLANVEDRLEDRLGSPDIQNHDTLKELLAEYRNQRPRRIRERGTQEPRFFISVVATRDEIDTVDTEERRPLEKLARTPLVGVIFRPFVTTQRDLSDAEVYERMFEKLEQRVDTAQETLVKRTPGFSGRRLSTIEMLSIQAKQLNHHRDGYDDLETVIRSSPAIGRAPNRRTEHDPSGTTSGQSSPRQSPPGGGR